MMKKQTGVTVRAVRVILGIFCIVLVMSVLLTGCGGGGGGNHDPSPAPTDLPTFRAIGVGVIMQSRSTLTVSSINRKTINPVWKKVDLSPGIYWTQSVPKFRASSIDLTDKIAMIVLAWDKVAGDVHYQVFYQGEKVWDSTTVDTAKDPAFEPDNPQAYLDLDDNRELGGRITTAGQQYQFQIKALSGDTVIAQASVTASLGMHLQSLPANIGFSNSNLTWDPVTNAGEYRISFKLEHSDTITSAKVDSGTVTYDASAVLTPSTPPKYYDVYVDARYLDTGGNPVEISRGIGPTIER